MTPTSMTGSIIAARAVFGSAMGIVVCGRAPLQVSAIPYVSK
jgi:hypothetical protein